MKKVVLEVPSLYADHHVTEARCILLELPGVKEVYASSAFHSLEVTFDAKKVDEAAIRQALEPTGYLNELPTPSEPGIAMTEDGGRMYARHTASYTQSGQAVSFAQLVGNPSNAAWACPGMGLLKTDEEK